MKNMKKRICLVVLFMFTVFLCACQKKASPLIMPNAEDVISIDVSTLNKTLSHTDHEWIEEALSGITASKPTRKQCVQDTPLVESYYRIDIHAASETITIFAYKDNGKYYVEQPYQGIYRISKLTFEQLKKLE